MNGDIYLGVGEQGRFSDVLLSDQFEKIGEPGLRYVKSSTTWAYKLENQSGKWTRVGGEIEFDLDTEVKVVK